ncbi:Nn.00g043940.m01.CDS01 [Neocucurbitaria sp. VM-36]
MSPNTTMDPCISYGRGGAGNMRRRSSILDAWSKITAQPANNNKLALFSSPEDHYANSKSEPRMSTSSTNRRRASSMWSSSTAGEHHRSVWKRLFRKGSVAEEEEEKVVESE